MRNSPFWWILIGFMVVLDIYFFQALKTITQSGSPRTRLIVYTVYWVISVSAILILLLLPYLKFQQQSWLGRSTVFAMIAGLFFAKLIASVFFLTDDMRRGVQWLAERFSTPKPATDPLIDERISRSVFLSWTGMIAGGGLFSSLLFGFGNKYRYELRRVKLAFANLPSSFKGLKVVQLSDIHSGSFTDKDAVKRGIEKVMKEEPDLIFFTGDLVNNKAEEMLDYMDVFEQLKAPLGVYSVLGNHDYGDYVTWDDETAKSRNLQDLKDVHHRLGWKLLLNEHIVLEKGSEKIAVLGVENWSSKANFHKYGDLEKAYAGSESHPFKILLSHDPSHWKGEVLEAYHDIDLVLSGHTHGMQFGVEIPGLKWSPVQYVYREWAGLYEHKREGRNPQKLYVNRGFGFLGYPGRVGILPEITVLEFS